MSDPGPYGTLVVVTLGTQLLILMDRKCNFFLNTWTFYLVMLCIFGDDDLTLKMNKIMTLSHGISKSIIIAIKYH